MTLTLHKYQDGMVDFVVDRLFTRDLPGAGLFADLGTGKTAAILTATQMLFDFGAIRRALYVAPLRVCYNTYPEEIPKWTPRLTYTNLHDNNAALNRMRLGMPLDTQIHLINPDSLFKLVEFAKFYDLIVVDESSGFKSWTSKGPRGRMRALRQMLPTIPKRAIMTGTPTPESLTELHSQIYILDNGEALGKNVTVFRARFCQQGGWKGRKWMLRAGVENELMGLVSPLVIRVDAESNLDMPKLIEHDLWVSLPPEAAEQYTTLKRELALELEKGDLLIGHAAALYGKLKQLSGGGVYHTDAETDERTSTTIHNEKIAALSDIDSELCGKPAIVLYEFQHEVPRILSALSGKVRVIDGRTSAKESEKTIKQWNARDIRYLVSHPRCLSHGLNLQSGGSDMVFFGLPDSCETYIQARARLWRQGQKDGVRIHRILARDTVEELQADRLRGKIKGQEEFLAMLKKHAKT